MKTLKTGAIVFAWLLTASALAGEPWSYEKHPLSAGYVLTNSETGQRTSTTFKSEKGAKKAAKALNKGDKSESSDGFMPTEEGPCADPLSGVHC